MATKPTFVDWTESGTKSVYANVVAIATSPVGKFTYCLWYDIFIASALHKCGPYVSLKVIVPDARVEKYATSGVEHSQLIEEATA